MAKQPFGGAAPQHDGVVRRDEDDGVANLVNERAGWVGRDNIRHGGGLQRSATLTLVRAALPGRPKRNILTRWTIAHVS